MFSLIALYTIICGTNNWWAIEEFGEAVKKRVVYSTTWIQLLQLPHTASPAMYPSPLNRQFRECFSSQTPDLANLTKKHMNGGYHNF